MHTTMYIQDTLRIIMNRVTISWGKNFKNATKFKTRNTHIKLLPYSIAPKIPKKNSQKIPHKSKTCKKMSHKTPNEAFIS